ncbi:TIGR04013 family B12-binding domain/radical SAM domain-containing protein [Methanocella sp. CWC-04]|uniref:TIGR04013 family B12-binding domain/radical SAM domain-containing protein n=1 Tax=Methanooceanicella nereidis TaxID=2052831 RepID=A0AAP2RCG2_9EURY|nr:TIGR04013 family B12-binding domain/radical SAM domain-containing protein [Methanocella sp. CWC-04]MCD1294773.1 TIGR04013 family B12-binding domain/radical SAM domain-containing protein [Methanocella sp. CWC-04]
MKDLKINFRWNPKNRYSIAVLGAVIKDRRLVKGPEDGIMLYSFASLQAEDVFKEVRSAKTDSVFIAGGPHPTGCPGETLKYFDYVVIGEGEETLPELINALREGKDVSGVRGIAYKDNESVVFTEKREYVDLNKYPPFEPPLFGPIEISRGCPWNCAYCQTPRIFGHRMRHRSVEQICKYDKFYEDKRLISPNAFAYGSNGVTPDVKAVEKLLSSLSGNIYFGTFPSEVRPEFVIPEMLDLVNAYCANKEIHLGGQSGSDKVLKAIHRGHTASDVIVAVERVCDAGLTPVVDFIFGLPGENEEDQMLTIDCIRTIIKDGGKIRAHYFMPLPGTELAGTTPAELSPEVEKLLGKLALGGRLTGSWSDKKKMKK